MKNKWDQGAVNNQEDEDGFNLNPVSVYTYENIRGNQEINSGKNSADPEPGSAEFVMITPGTRKRISQLILSTSANLRSQ